MGAVRPWTELLDQWNSYLLNCPALADYVEPVSMESRWLGERPAGDDQIRRAEKRLGRTLPPSYHAFLSLTNGWRYVGEHTSFAGALRPVEHIDWFRVANAAWVDAYAHVDADDLDYLVYGPAQDTTHMRGKYLADALQVSDVARDGGGVILLNPEVCTDDGEWEAWHLANYYPGAVRHRSFRHLAEQLLADQRFTIVDPG
jgi:hypothetical protein